MTQEQHPITPPDELVEKWSPSIAIDQATAKNFQVLATQAARWGADQELDACCDWLITGPYGACIAIKPASSNLIADLRAARRPKPPSLKEQALETLRSMRIDHFVINGVNLNDVMAKYDIIRRALEALPD